MTKSKEKTIKRPSENQLAQWTKKGLSTDPARFNLHFSFVADVWGEKVIVSTDGHVLHIRPAPAAAKIGPIDVPEHVVVRPPDVNAIVGKSISTMLDLPHMDRWDSDHVACWRSVTKPDGLAMAVNGPDMGRVQVVNTSKRYEGAWVDLYLLQRAIPRGEESDVVIRSNDWADPIWIEPMEAGPHGSWLWRAVVMPRRMRG